LSELVAHFKETEPRGEIVVVVGGKEKTKDEKRNINQKSV
jgi:16S rRNA (cytidine1402-2'-O)-methyltransferase